ncbi:PD-(D/E)XK nuclease family protein [Pseudanabaena biceps]|nr:PD-(D/E)XK nuclease family protein [Pseudanabaena biceps]
MVLQERKSAMTAISIVNSKMDLRVNSISQAHLNTWDICQRRYKYKFLEELSLPEADLQSKQSLLLGANFHLLMQQREMGLDVMELAESEAKLQSWLNAFATYPPEMIAGDRFCEHRRTLEMPLETFAISNDPNRTQTPLHHIENNDAGQGYFVLTAIYDFLILGDRRAQILDWKTHQRAIAKEKLETSWQTRLYLYLLAQTTDYLPEQLSMTYWFANTATSVVIEYSQNEHDRTDQNLKKILNEISYAQDYLKLAMGSPECKHCEFRDRCDRGDLSNSEFPSNISDIPEVEI